MSVESDEKTCNRLVFARPIRRRPDISGSLYLDHFQFGPTRGAAQDGALRRPRAGRAPRRLRQGHRARNAARKTLRRVKQAAVMDRHCTVFRAQSHKEAAQTTVAPCWRSCATRQTCVCGSRCSNGRSRRSRTRAGAAEVAPRREGRREGRGRHRDGRTRRPVRRVWCKSVVRHAPIVGVRGRHAAARRTLLATRTSSPGPLGDAKRRGHMQVTLGGPRCRWSKLRAARHGPS